jgi:hypothetical protein
VQGAGGHGLGLVLHVIRLPQTLPVDRKCRIEGIAYPYVYALACMFLTIAAVVTLAS